MKKIKLPIGSAYVFDVSGSDLEKSKPIKTEAGVTLRKIGEVNLKNPDVDIAIENAAQVIYATVSIEQKLETIISHYLFGIGIGPDLRRGFFLNHVITSSAFTFAVKKELVFTLVHENKWLKSSDKSKLQNVLASVTKYRNAFAHGHLATHAKKGVVLRSRKEQMTVDDQLLDRITAVFQEADAILKQVQKKLSEHLIGITK